MLDGDLPSTTHFFPMLVLDCGRVVEHVKFKILKTLSIAMNKIVF